MKDPEKAKKAMEYLIKLQIINGICIILSGINLVTVESIVLGTIFGSIAFILLISTLYIGIKYT